MFHAGLRGFGNGSLDPWAQAGGPCARRGQKSRGFLRPLFPQDPDLAGLDPVRQAVVPAEGVQGL